MSPIHVTQTNPFGITKAVDLNDEQILSLWVDVAGDAEEFAEFTRPISPMPTFIMGAKGSGKTHLMRYHAFELQTLRYKQKKFSLRDGVMSDGYIGIYMRCSGLNSGRFADKRQPPEVWKELFAYYIELWLTQHLLHVMKSLELGETDADEKSLCVTIIALFDKKPSVVPSTMAELGLLITQLQRQLDFEVNNCVLTDRINVEVLATRGRLVFGIPKLLAARYRFLRNVLFVYSIDEFENLTSDQQKLINTLVREKELPSTLRIGSRLYGVKTHATDSAEEENLQNSEFESLYLDQLFRTHKKRYSTFAKELIEKRLAAAYGLPRGSGKINAIDIRWEEFFETCDDSWRSVDIVALVKGRPSHERRHFVAFREKVLAGGVPEGTVDKVISNLSAPDFPILEKVNLLLFYQGESRGVDSPLSVSAEIRRMCRDFIENQSTKGRYGAVLDHFKSDLIAQLRRENDAKQCYLGLDTFIAMSAGLPRALLTILRSVFEWSLFNGEDPLRTSRVSVSAQQRGVKDASDWFYENMRKAGDDGIAIQTAIDRLAQLFRVNRFSDKPAECSLIAFSVAEEDAGAEALRILRLCESRSFLNKIAGGQRDKNSERVTMKFQLSNMLSPRWDLPLGRRGAVALDARQFGAIFDVTEAEKFKEVLSDWRERMTAPDFGRSRTRRSSSQQHTLF
jgi:hypothetical protein